MMDTGSFKSVTRSVNVRYPIPFLLVVLLAFALAVLSGSILVDGLLRWMLFGLALPVVLAALAILVFAIIYRSDLLRSESYVIRMRELEIAGDSDHPLSGEQDILEMEQISKEPATEIPALGRSDTVEDAGE